MLKIQSKGGQTLLCENGQASLSVFPSSAGKPTGENNYVLLDSPQEEYAEHIVSWPGEYDYGGVSIRGIGQKEGKQVSYIVTADNIRCGFVSSPMQEFTEADEEIIGDLDVLVVPAEDVKKVQKLVEDVDPRVVIPINTGDEKIFREVVAVCGGKEVEEVSEVKLKKSSLPTESREVYVLKS
jgi:hypothetical protein